MARSIIEDVRESIRSADAFYRLIYANIGVYLFILITNSLFSLFTVNNDHLIKDYAVKWLAVPKSPALLIIHPWTLITYMFLHIDFFHILFNLLWLYWMGTILREFLGSKKVFSAYILGGLCGAILYLFAINVFPLFSNSDAMMFGASAGVMAVTVAAATLVPNYPVRLILIGSVPLKYIALVSVILDLVGLGKLDNVAHFAHIGGAIYGFIYIIQLQKGNDTAEWFIRLTDKLTVKSSNGSKMKMTYRRAVSDEDYLADKKSEQEHIDEILEKISKSGYGSLTQSEKDILFKSSKKD